MRTELPPGAGVKAPSLYKATPDARARADLIEGRARPQQRCLTAGAGVCAVGLGPRHTPLGHGCGGAVVEHRGR